MLLTNLLYSLGLPIIMTGWIRYYFFIIEVLWSFLTKKIILILQIHNKIIQIYSEIQFERLNRIMHAGFVFTF